MYLPKLSSYVQNVTQGQFLNGLNSEFSFFWIGCFIKAQEHEELYYLDYFPYLNCYTHFIFSYFDH